MRKYVMYAFGEIALIVIGILLALQINNWNEWRKESILEEKLFTELFQEFVRNHDYNKELLHSSFETHSEFIEELLLENQILNIDSFVIKYKDHWPIEKYSLLNYVYGFTDFYDPPINFYRTSVNDGTISIIKKKKFVFGLESVYEEGKNQLERLYIKETNINGVLQKYISDKYGQFFEENLDINSGTWGNNVTKALLKELVKDGQLRYQLFIKLTILKSKAGILENIISHSQKIIDEYGEN